MTPLEEFDIILDEQKRPQLQEKLEEYKGRIRAIMASQDDSCIPLHTLPEFINAYTKMVVLTFLLEEKHLNLPALSQYLMQRQLWDVEAFGNALCAVRAHHNGDYSLIEGGTGLPSVEQEF